MDFVGEKSKHSSLTLNAILKYYRGTQSPLTSDYESHLSYLYTFFVSYITSLKISILPYHPSSLFETP